MKTMSDLLKEYVLNTVKLLVDNPDEVEIESIVSTKSIIIQIKCRKTDLGKVIGKKGKTISSLKTIALAMKNTNFPKDVRKVALEIIEDEQSSFLDLDKS